MGYLQRGVPRAAAEVVDVFVRVHERHGLPEAILHQHRLVPLEATDLQTPVAAARRWRQHGHFLGRGVFPVVLAAVLVAVVVVMAVVVVVAVAVRRLR